MEPLRTLRCVKQLHSYEGESLYSEEPRADILGVRCHPATYFQMVPFLKNRHNKVREGKCQHLFQVQCVWVSTESFSEPAREFDIFLPKGNKLSRLVMNPSDLIPNAHPTEARPTLSVSIQEILFLTALNQDL